MNYVRTGYDEELGLETEIPNYILDSHQVQLRIGGTPCYLLQQRSSGSVIPVGGGTLVGPVNTITSWDSTAPNYIKYLWTEGQSNYKPDIRPYTNSGSGSIIVWINGAVGNRVDYEDITYDNDYAIRERLDLSQERVELILNDGFVPSTVSYTYSDVEQHYNQPQSNSLSDVGYSSIHGWSQYKVAALAPYTGLNQILVRFPLTVQTLGWKEYGLEILKQNHCWTLASPYIHNGDILVVPSVGEVPEQRFEIYDKEDSLLRSVLLSQRFKVQIIENSEAAYRIPVETS